ncbi:LOW QUALITY PROTEIN: proteasome subunit beta type-1-B-like [Pollicipes pollicipes]|uniref:proteasome subunit beta type-1-B-like n=1 Tax=Pollicipes pollicipes TaxID=41117 RepID=UPI001884CCFD|nr:proteasome subunit beta type-1-B-like [Pollicipes pollicipes]XP_037068416.1 proteasome subunit beta type-1-B-like [Pollicipes pollicipes]XP_037069401.1 LOW QUALITY PROTEIN: proteasome subunit beta type-1-B-like [Pollicipes pollicipes]
MSLRTMQPAALDAAGGAKQHHFYPYADNGGTVVAIAGDDFVVVASDTRLSSGYSIYTREQKKTFKLSDSTILGSTGCWCDVLTMTKVLEARMQMYKHEHNKPMSTGAVAQMLSTMLYHKRFFPYYVSNVLAGLDENGKGIVYHYDPVGHHDPGKCYTGGSGGALIQPLLDNQINYKNQENVTPEALTIPKTVSIIKDVFTSACERDIYTGDSVAIQVITKDGIKEEMFPLRRD